jgi:peptide/nickel transport system permease protein
MVRYIIRRLLWVVVLLILVSFLTFIIFYTLPSADPAQLRAGRQPNPELVQQIRENLGLSDPWYQQYFHYMEDLVLHFDLGYSYQNTYPVKDQIFDRLPASISLAIGAAVIWLLLGISIGVISAVRSRSALDRLTMGLALIAISAPVYWLGLVSLYLFSDDIGVLPLFMGAGSYVPLSQDPWLWAGSLIMPWFVLAAAFAAFYARLAQRGSASAA